MIPAVIDVAIEVGTAEIFAEILDVFVGNFDAKEYLSAIDVRAREVLFVSSNASEGDLSFPNPLQQASRRFYAKAEGLAW